MSDQNGVLVRALDIVKEYRSLAGGLEVLKGVDMELRRGEILAVTGSSPSERYRALTEQHGAPVYERIDAPADRDEKADRPVETVAQLELGVGRHRRHQARRADRALRGERRHGSALRTAKLR